MDGGWSHSESPFHPGEQQVQERLGLRDKLEVFGRRVIRDYLPQQHRDFYGALPFVLIGSVDDRGRPWASLLAGQPGFMASPDPRHLSIDAQPLPGDPLAGTLHPGASLGLLGLQPETRRRNRLTGRVQRVGQEGFDVAISQSFGNCPQYIQTRAVQPLTPSGGDPAEPRIERSGSFDAATRQLIETADTLFIATAYSGEGEDASFGVDVSHRGGRPGFVRIEDDRTFVFPDFSGNNHFNTVGNIVLNPRAGFLFLDFEAGDLVYMTGRADIVWEGDEVRTFTGAERLIRFGAEEVIRVERGLPLRFEFGEYSPLLARTGSWTEAAEAAVAERARSHYRPLEVVDVVPESAEITSFTLRDPMGEALPPHEPGQFLPIRLALPGQAEPSLRTYTLSHAANGAHYRLSIKREGGDAVVSTFFHDRVKEGFRLEAMAPRGHFTLDRASDRPVVLLSGGVGITPMIAMTEALIEETKVGGTPRPIYFLHGTRNGRSHAFGNHVRNLSNKHSALTAHIRYSDPGADDRLGISHDSEGHVDVALLKAMLPFDDYDFYLCGPPAFMQSLYDGLIGLGVRDARIHYESFGPATVLKHDAGDSAPGEQGPADGPVPVRFAQSEVETEWSPDKGTLLELAEAAGLNPDFSCRSGVCGTCATRLRSGSVHYLEEPSAPRDDDEVLICCATPRPDPDESCRGEDCGVVLEL